MLKKLKKARIKPKGDSEFTLFIREASAAEKKKVYTRVNEESQRDAEKSLGRSRRV